MVSLNQLKIGSSFRIMHCKLDYSLLNKQFGLLLTIFNEGAYLTFKSYSHKAFDLF